MGLRMRLGFGIKFTSCLGVSHTQHWLMSTHISFTAKSPEFSNLGIIPRPPPSLCCLKATESWVGVRVSDKIWAGVWEQGYSTFLHQLLTPSKEQMALPFLRRLISTYT